MAVLNDETEMRDRKAVVAYLNCCPSICECYLWMMSFRTFIYRWWQMNGQGALVKWYWQGKMEALTRSIWIALGLYPVLHGEWLATSRLNNGTSQICLDGTNGCI